MACLLVQLGEGELRSAVDGNEEMELTLLGPDLSDVDVEVADGVALELGAARLIALGVRQPADPMALQAAVQAGAPQVRDRRLKRVEAVVERQQRVPAEGDDDCLLLGREHGRAGLLRPHARVG